MYYEGQDVTQDYKAASKWYKLAAEQGYADAQSQLAKMYFSGTGVNRDFEAAYNWWTK